MQEPSNVNRLLQVGSGSFSDRIKTQEKAP